MRHYFLAAALLLGACATLDKNFNLHNAITNEVKDCRLPAPMDKDYYLAPITEIPVPKSIAYGVLDNGLTYYVKGKTGDYSCTPGQAEFRLVQKTGSLMEDDNLLGVAHYLEHMAFQGSRFFPGKGIIDCMNRNGLPFGSGLNASTSFLYTCYELSGAPVAITDTCLLVLREFADGLSLTGEAMETERIAILEEERMRGSSYYFPLLYSLMAGTRYERPIIGTPESIRRITINDIRDYYNKWYQPQNQAVIVMGDVDVNKTVDKIRAVFGDMVKGASSVPEYDYAPAKHSEPRVLILRDHTISDARVGFYFNMDGDTLARQKNTIAWYYDKVINNKIMKMLQNRLSRQKAETGLFEIIAGDVELEPKDDYFYKFTLGAAPDNWEETLAEVSKTLERIRRYGFTEKELNSVEIINDGNSLNDIINHFVQGSYIHSFAGKGDDVVFQSHGVSDDHGQYYPRFRKMDCDSNLAIVVVVPDNGNATLPAESDVLRIYHAARAGNLDDDKFRNAESPNYCQMMSDIPAIETPAKVVSKRKVTIGNLKEYTLSNGVKVVIHDNNYYRFQISMLRPGASTAYGDSDFRKLRILNNIVKDDFGNLTESNGKIFSNINFYDLSDDMFSYFDHNPAQAIPEEMLFRLVNYRLTHLAVDSAKLDNYKRLLKSKLTAEKPAASMLNEYCQNLIHDDAYALRFAPLTASEVDSLNFKEMDALCKDYMSNFNGAVFLIEGDFNDGDILDLAARYFGNLPSKAGPVSLKDIPAFRLRDKDTSAVFRYSAPKPKADLISIYAKENGFGFNSQTAACLEMIARITRRLLDENIRFKDGGLYSAWSYYSLMRQPKPQMRLTLQTTCDPDSKDYIMGKFAEIVDSMANGGLITEQVVNDCKAMLLENADRNYFGKSGDLFHSYYRNGESGLIFTQKDVQSITPEKLRQLLKNLISNGNHYELMMIGE